MNLISRCLRQSIRQRTLAVRTIPQTCIHPQAKLYNTWQPEPAPETPAPKPSKRSKKLAAQPEEPGNWTEEWGDITAEEPIQPPATPPAKEPHTTAEIPTIPRARSRPPKVTPLSSAFPEFVPRKSFGDPGNLATSYFLGHHKKALTRISEMMNNIDLVIECRDYRVALSSRNPMFEETLQGKPKIIVYTKRDLGSHVLNGNVRDIITRWHAPHPVVFTSAAYKRDIMILINKCIAMAKDLDKLTGMRVLVCGMPNVGKSTLLNSLRFRGDPSKKTKAARTGAQAGITRNLSHTIRICENPLIYCVDTPGVFVPYLPHAETMLKLALCGCVGDSIIPFVTLADYLLFCVNKRGIDIYLQWMREDQREPTNDVNVLLQKIAMRIGKMKKNGEPDVDAAAIFFVNKYRSGALGRFFLDEVKKLALMDRMKEEAAWGESLNAGRKRMREERAERSRARAVKGGVQISE